LLLEIYRAYFLPGASLGSFGAVRLEQACSTPGGGGGGGWRSTPAFSSPQQQGCHPPRGGARPQDPIRARRGFQPGGAIFQPGHRLAAGRSASAPRCAHVLLTVSFCSLLLTFAHFLLTFGSRFAEFLLNLAHICTFFCSFSAHFLLTFSSLSPHFSARSGVTGTATTAATTLEQPPRVSTEVICRCLWLTDLLWQI